MIRSDFHMHSTFSDGKNTPEEMIETALARGMERLGFTEHGYAYCDRDSCIPRERMDEYIAEITRLKEKYRGRIEIRCGMEQDYFSDPVPAEIEYTIGSVHYLNRGEDYRSVDYRPEDLEYMAENWFGGDYIALAEAYFERVSEIYDRTGCDIIGHFDLITKLNERHNYFDTGDERYRTAWQRAADRLLKTGKAFEINTGAIARGYRSTPYPAMEIQRYISERGGRFLLSSDSHSAQTLCFQFDVWERKAAEAGIRLVEF